MPKLHRLIHCAVCGVQHVQRGRGQSTFCSTRCRYRAVYLQQKASGQRAKQNAARYARYKGADRYAIDGPTVFERDGWLCGFCGEPIPPEAKWPDRMSASVDHVVPLALGGKHAMENVRAAHLGCNSQAGAGIRESRRDQLEAA